METLQQGPEMGPDLRQLTTTLPTLWVADTAESG